MPPVPRPGFPQGYSKSSTPAPAAPTTVAAPAPATTPRQEQQRLRRFIRQPEKLESRQLTRKGLELLATVERYRLLPSSLLVRLVAGGQRNNYRHLQTLFHKGLLSHFALPTIFGTPGEQVHYIDALSSFQLLIEKGLIAPDAADRAQREEIIRYNRQKNWAALHKDPDQQGKLLYIQHELMVSRFRFMLEMACRHPKLSGKVTLEQWKQGSELYSKIEAPKVRPHHQDDISKRTVWEELATTEHLPHRPDAFFTLYFPAYPEGQQRRHFLYEADRGTERTPRFKKKLRGHYHFIVKHNRNRQPPYNVQRIRAVLTETTTTKWRDNLIDAAKENIVSPSPNPLFWFASSEDLITPVPAGKKTLPRYLIQPEVIFTRLWHSCVDSKILNLGE